eukprot:gene311-567_t
MPGRDKKKKNVKQVRLKLTDAAHLVDKNSRTIIKLFQLLEVSQSPGAAVVDCDGAISRRIEKLKMRLNRRLIKLAKWTDSPIEERQPPEIRMLTRQADRGNEVTRAMAVKMGLQNKPPAPTPSIYMQKQAQLRLAQANALANPKPNTVRPTRAMYDLPSSVGNGIPSQLPSLPGGNKFGLDMSISELMARQQQMVMSLSNNLRMNVFPQPQFNGVTAPMTQNPAPRNIAYPVPTPPSFQSLVMRQTPTVETTSPGLETVAPGLIQTELAAPPVNVPSFAGNVPGKEESVVSEPLMIPKCE